MFRKIPFIVLTIILVIILGLSGCSKSPKPKRTPAGTLKLGTSTLAATGTVSPAGTTISVNQANSVLNGLQMTIPANSYPNTRQFKISSAPVESQTFGSNFSPITPLISVDNGGGYSNEIISLQIPVQVPAGNFAMAFYYDDKLGTLEGIPTTASTANSITIATRHFSKIVVSSIAESALSSNAEIDTGFEPGVDDWQFTNYGSYISPGGQCAGQSITALWYYSQMKANGEPSLYNRYDESTSDFWYDDARAYRFASTIQEDVDWNAWLTRYGKLKPQAQAANSMVWDQFVYSMKVTGQPQFIYIQNTAAGGGAHAMIVYGVSGGALQIADPNYPGSNGRQIWYENGQFEPYNSGANARAILDGHGEAYDLMLYFGTSSLVNFENVSTRWSEFENGTIGNDRFPSYTVMYTNDDGETVALKDGYTTKNQTVTLTMSSDSPLAFYVYRDGQLLNATEGGNEYTLLDGNNQLGVYTVGDKGKGENDWKYVDFKYFNIIKAEPTTTTKTSAQGVPVVTDVQGPTQFQFDANLNVTGKYNFSVTVEGGSPPYYYTWMGVRAPQLLVEGPEYSNITISPQEMRTPGWITEGYFVWFTVKDAKGNYAFWTKPGGQPSNEFMYGLKFTGKIETIDGTDTVVENTWEVQTEP